MKTYVKSYNKLSYIVRVLIAIFPLTGWFNAFLYRFAKKRLIAGVLALIFAPVSYVVDLITVIFTGKPKILA